MNHDIISTLNTGFSYIEKAYVPNISNILVITDELKSLIQQYFCKPVPPFTLVNNLRFDYPMTTSSYDEIHICCLDTSWSQIAYQLSHEFCHLMIGKDVTQNMRWFEETIAEVSSLFFMLKLSSVWSQKGILGYPEYGKSLFKYVQQKIDSVDSRISLSDIANSSPLRKHLVTDPYDRLTNLKIAKHLFPIFEENPSLWEVVPYLGNLSPDADLAKSFQEWKDFSAEKHHSDLEKIFKCFIVPDNSN